MNHRMKRRVDRELLVDHLHQISPKLGTRRKKQAYINNLN